MRRIAIFFLICPEERSIIAESGLIAGFCDGGAPAQELVCVLEAFFSQVFGNGVAGFLAEEAHHVVFAHLKAGGELVDGVVFFWVFREVAHEFQDFFAGRGGRNVFPMVFGGGAIKVYHKFQE